MATNNMIRTGFFLAAILFIFMIAGFLIAGRTGMMIAFFIALAINFFSYWNSDKVVLKMYKAYPASPSHYPNYFEIVKTLAHKAKLPCPKIYVIEDDQPNAFATGRNPENAAVVATTGLLQRLTKEEISGVMAHEIAHIENRDILTMTICATFAGALSMLSNFGFLFPHHSNQEQGENNHNPLGFIGVLLAMILAPFLAMLIQMAVSRTREYSADFRGGQLCGNPLWLASALNKIAQPSNDVKSDQEKYNPATAHMFIINPLKGKKSDNFFTTHPATENRISELEKQAKSMGIFDINYNSSIQKAKKPSWMRFKNN